MHNQSSITLDASLNWYTAMDNNGKAPEGPKDITVTAKMDIQAQTATFIETKVGGLVMLQPKEITVPLQTILIMAAQATLAMMGVQPGQASQVKGPAGPQGPRRVP